MDKFSLNRFFLNESDDIERKIVLRYLLNPENDLLIKNWMKANWDMACSFANSSRDTDPDVQKLWDNILQKIQEKESVSSAEIKNIDLPARQVRYKINRFAAAAAIIVAVVFGLGYFIKIKKSTPENLASITAPTQIKINDVPAPVVSKAVLTLADGTNVYLDRTENGTLATQGKVNVSKNKNGEIVYSGTPSDVISYNTLSLPKGSKPIRLVLADGSLVWLNAASSVTYPTAFTGSERKVDITGEAYFEVSKNSAMPFHVAGAGMLVKVLGTHFNVNTYSDESETRITLLEGSVDVSGAGKNKILRPGQQARLSANKLKVVNDVDINEVMAWKNGQFYFAGTDIKSIMRQIEKYYNVEVEYRDDVPYQFVAKISRQVNISEFLEKLELTNLIHFEIKGNKVIVTK